MISQKDLISIEAYRLIIGQSGNREVKFSLVNRFIKISDINTSTNKLNKRLKRSFKRSKYYRCDLRDKIRNGKIALSSCKSNRALQSVSIILTIMHFLIVSVNLYPSTLAADIKMKVI